MWLEWIIKHIAIALVANPSDVLHRGVMNGITRFDMPGAARQRVTFFARPKKVTKEMPPRRAGSLLRKELPFL
jgi:hypothetical protein